MGKIALNKVLGKIYYLPEEMQAFPESAIACYKIKDINGNIGYCCVVENEKDECIQNGVYAEIEESEIENFVDCDDEYVLECTGRYEVDPDEINDLVTERDEHTLEFFGITEMSDEELDEWDAYDVDLPFVCDFVEGFEAESPFDAGWTLRVNYSNHPEEEDLDKDEAVKTLTELLKKADGDYSVLDDYVERCDNLFTGGSLQLLACSIARELNLQDYADTHTTEVE